MFELQKDFLLGFLMPFLAELHTPLIHVENRKAQRTDLPEELHIYAATDEVPQGMEIIRLDEPS